MVKRIAALVLVIVLLGVGDVLAAPKFSLEVGKSYLFVYECFPQVDCYAEPVTIVAIDRKANRVLTVGDWWINLDMVRASKELVEAKPDKKPAATDDTLRVQADGRNERSNTGTPLPLASR